MDLLSLPFEKDLGSQLLGRNDVCNLKGGFIKGSQYAWLSQGPHLYLISTAEGTQVDLCTFASMPAADPEVEMTTEVTCVVELAQCDGRNAHQLIVGLNHNNQTGMVCIFDTSISRIVRAVHMPSTVTSLSVVDHGLSDRDSRQVLHQILREMDGILAVGLSKGEVCLVDLRRCDYERATSHSRCRDEFDVCYLLHVLPSNPRLGNEERLRRQEGDHMCVFINSMYLRETGMLVDKVAQTGCELISQDVSVSCLQYVPLVVGLIVGYDKGFFQLWNMRNLKLEYSSYLRNRRMGSVSHVVFQEPNDDPHPVCYLWTTHEDATQHAAVLYSLVYGMWEYIDSHGYVYKKFVSAMELSVCDTDLKSDARARFLDCYCLERMKEAVRVQGQEEADLSLAVFVWEQRRGGCVTTHAHLFDMNEWLKEHHCPEENRMQRSHVTFPVPAGALAVSVQPESLRHFSTLQRLDKHLSPFALSFHWLALMPCSVEKGWCEGVQKKLVTEILGRGPTCLVDSDLVMRCMKASLQPTIGCDEPPQTEVERKKFLLNLMLEYCYSPDVFFGSSDNASDFRLLSLLHVWGWERAQVLKDNIDQLSVRLFDSTGVRVDEMWHSELRHCGTQLLTLYMLFSQLEKLAGESLSKVWEHKEGIMLMHVYYVVLQWFVTKGLLPESVDYGSAIPYPVVEIKHFYMARRKELAARDQTLFIDQFLEHECEEEDLLRLGFVNGLYPPHSVQCLVKMYLLSEIPLSVKNILTTYVFKDVIAHLDENRRRCAVQELKDFASKLQLADSVVRLAESLWLFDHESFQEGVSVLTNNNVAPADVMPWLHTNIVNMLVSQHQFSSALAFMKWNKMASKSKEDARLYLMVCLAEKSFDAAFQFVREFCREGTWRDVLQHFFTYCERAGLLKKVMHQPLSDYEEQEFLNYLRRSSLPDSEDIRVLYFTMRGRVAQGLAENDRINQERLHRSCRRRLQCDEMVPLRQLMANIYCKVLPKDWRREEDQKVSLALPIMEKTLFDATLHEKSSAGGGSKRPRLSRDVRSTLHSLYVGSPGFPHISAAQSTTTTPQGILKVRSYPSTRDTSVETLITASSTSNLLDIPESEPLTPARRIQFRISSDYMEKMELDEGADEDDETEVVSLLGKEQNLLDSVKPSGVFNKEVITNNHGIVAQQSTSDEGESDSEVDLPANLQEPEMINEVQQAIRESPPKMRDELQLTSKESSPDMRDEIQRASRESSVLSSDTTAASDIVPCDKSTTARTSDAAFKRSTTASPLLVTDITRFNRRGIGPRRPLPAANREAASKMFVSSVTKKTRTTESSMSVAEKFEFSNASFGRRYLNFGTDDSSKHSKITDEQNSSLENEKIIMVEVESKVQFDNDSARNERGSMSAVDTSQESCILSIDISDDTFGDVSKLGDLSQCDSRTNLVEQSDAVSDSQVEDIAMSEKIAADWHKSIVYCTSNSTHLSDDPLLVHPSNIEQTVDVRETHREPSIDALLKNEQRKDSLALSDKSLEPTHDTTVSDSEVVNSVAVSKARKCISVSVEGASPLSDNEAVQDVCISFTATDVKTSSGVSKMGMEGVQSNLEQGVSSRALVEVVVPYENVEGSGFDDISEPAKVVDELSEAVHESQVVSRENTNTASEGTAFSCTDVTELLPNEKSAPCNVSETLPSLTTSTGEEAQALQLISKANSRDENLNSNKSDVLLNVSDKGADSFEMEVSDVLQSKPIRIERIPFDLSPELLSRESFSSSVHEGIVQVTDSSDVVTKRDQAVCDSLSEMSHDVHIVANNEHRTETSETAKASPVPAECIDDIEKAVEVSFADKQDEIKPSEETDTSANDITLRQVPQEMLSEKSLISLVQENVLQIRIGDNTNGNQTTCDSSEMSHNVPHSTTAQKHTTETTGAADCLKEAVVVSFIDKQDVSNVLEEACTSTNVDGEPTVCKNEKLVNDVGSLRQVSQEVLSKTSPVSWIQEDVMQVTDPIEDIADGNQTTCGDSSEVSRDIHITTIWEHTVETSKIADTSSRVDGVKEAVLLSDTNKQDTNKPLETNVSSSVNREGIGHEKEQSENYDASSVYVEGADREAKSIQNYVSSKISKQCLPSYVEKGHVAHITETDVSLCNEGNKNVIKVMNIFDSSVKIVEYSGGNIVQGEVSVPVAAVVCPDGIEGNMSVTSSGTDLSQLGVALSRSVREDTVQDMKEVVASAVQTETSEARKIGNPTSCDVLLNILVQDDTQKEHAPVDSVEESERPNVRVGHTDGIENGKREQHTASSNLFELHAPDLPCIAGQAVTASVVETADIPCFVSTENNGNKINAVSSLPLIPKEGLLSSGTWIDASQSASDEACVTSAVPARATESENRVQESSRVESTEMLMLCQSNNEKEESVILSVTSDLSTPGYPESTDNKEENQTADTASEVLQQDVGSSDSPHNALSESQNVVVSSPNLKETNSETPAIADDSVHLGNNKLIVPTRGVLELRTRSVEKYSLDDTDLQRNIRMKRKPKLLEPPTGMLKKCRSMSVLSLDLGVLQEASTPPRRQRRASLSCSGELRHGTPPPRRSLRLSGAASSIEDDLPSTVSGPSMRLPAREKRKGRVPKKQLQTVYEDMELTTEAARKKLEAEGPYPDTSLSNPFMMPRRFTRSQLRMMKQNVRLEEMRSLGSKSPSFTCQLSAEDDASDEDDGRPPSICGSEVSSLVTVSGDQSESGHRSPRVRRRSYNLRSHASQSPVSEVSHTQSTSSHDDMSSVVSGMSEYHQKDLELGPTHKEGSRRPRKTCSSRLSLHLPEELSSPTDSLQSQVTEDERNIKRKEIRRSPRKPYTSDSHDQTSTTSFSDAGPSPAAKDDDVSSTSSSDHHILQSHAVTRQKRDKRRQTRQVSSTANPTKKTKVSVEESTASPRSSHSRQRYSRSAVHGRKSVRVRSSTSATAKSKGT